jgi:hypothetical protein
MLAACRSLGTSACRSFAKSYQALRQGRSARPRPR